MIDHVFSKESGTLEHLVIREHKNNGYKYQPNTLRKHLSNLRVILQFQKPIMINQINNNWLSQLYVFLRDKKMNIHNAIMTKFLFLRKYCGIAVNQNLIKENPFKFYKISDEEYTPVYLIPKEIETL